MSPLEIIQKLYQEDGIRNSNLLNELFSDDFVLEWDNSKGKVIMSKEDVLRLANELKQNYHFSKVKVIDNIISENKIVVRYTHEVATIENPKEIFSIAKVIVIWQYNDDKITAGYQISSPG